MARPRGFPAPSSPAPRGDGLRGAGAAASSRGASCRRRRRRRRLAIRLGPAPTARARLSLHAGLAGPRPREPGRAARSEGPPRPAPRRQAPGAPPPPPSQRTLSSAADAPRSGLCEETASPNFFGGRSRHLGLAAKDLKEECTSRANFVRGSWRVLGGQVETQIPRLCVSDLDTCLWNAPTASFNDPILQK